jgi:hypothetical protein
MAFEKSKGGLYQGLVHLRRHPGCGRAGAHGEVGRRGLGAHLGGRQGVDALEGRRHQARLESGDEEKPRGEPRGEPRANQGRTEEQQPCEHK